MNDSGTQTAVLPEELRGFNWGALLLTLIWGLVHRCWIVLCIIPLAFLPAPIGTIALICFYLYFGFKGNDIAWKNKKWDSIEHFQRIQNLWVKWGIGVFVVAFIFGALKVICNF
jgi:hypothetical protein